MSSIYGDQLLLDNIVRHDASAHFNQMLQQKLRQQQLESEEDSRWLAESETQLVSVETFCNFSAFDFKICAIFFYLFCFVIKKRLSISQPSTDDHESTPERSLTSLPTSPSYINQSTSFKGNGSVSSSKSHSPAGSLTNTMNLSGKHETSDTSQSGSVISDTEKKVNHFFR